MGERYIKAGERNTIRHLIEKINSSIDVEDDECTRSSHK